MYRTSFFRFLNFIQLQDYIEIFFYSFYPCNGVSVVKCLLHYKASSCETIAQSLSIHYSSQSVNQSINQSVKSIILACMGLKTYVSLIQFTVSRPELKRIGLTDKKQNTKSLSGRESVNRLHQVSSILFTVNLRLQEISGVCVFTMHVTCK